MQPSEVKALIANGETSGVQFKLNVTNAVSISQEMVAFSNTKGGIIIIGVNDKNGEVAGLHFQDIQRINNLLVAAAAEHVKSAISIETETVEVYPDKRVIIVQVPEGAYKPYKDKDGIIFVKNGSDKRKVTSNEELMRMLQIGGRLYAEEQVLRHCNYGDIDWEMFARYYEKTYGEALPAGKEQVFENLRLGEQGQPTIAGALLFTNNPAKAITGFFITAIWFQGKERGESIYKASENIRGNLTQQYQKAKDFVVRALHHIQPPGASFNSLGVPEIPPLVIEELLTNALVHRDYFIRDTIKLYIFEDRVEIISPGKLPNNLTVEQAKRGIRKRRNDIIDSFATELLSYRGAGSGIVRALRAYPAIEFINDVEAEQFTVIIERPAQV